jgi:CheY-like chemotaxis protein
MSWKPLILCVDETPGLLEGQKVLLEENGYRVLTATNGREAVQLFVSRSVDLVLLDDHAPELNGGEAALRMNDAKPDVPIALVSDDDCLSRCVLEAVDCIVPKSQPIVSFLEEIDYLLSIRFLFRPFGGLKAQNTEAA